MNLKSLFKKKPKTVRGRWGQKKRIPDRERRFEGKLYRLVPVSSTRKVDMQEKAREYRNRGYLARLVHLDGQWLLYVRG